MWVCQIFITILILFHWFIYLLHLIGSLQEDYHIGEQTWLIVDEMQDETVGRQYLRLFFW